MTTQHVTAYGAIEVGREKQAMAVWGDALDIYEKAKANGIIESYEIQIFQPTGGALPVGMITLWGSEDQVDQISRHEDRLRLQARASLVVENLVEDARDAWCRGPRGCRQLPAGDRQPVASSSR